MIDVTKASRETKDRVVAAYAEWREARLEPGALPVAQELDRAWQQLRAECAAPKLRSRAEVDSEIATTARVAFVRPYAGLLTEHAKRLTQLCAEPTAEEPAELDLAEHEVCSCEEAEKLKARVAILEEQLRQSEYYVKYAKNMGAMISNTLELAK